MQRKRGRPKGVRNKPKVEVHPMRGGLPILEESQHDQELPRLRLGQLSHPSLGQLSPPSSGQLSPPSLGHFTVGAVHESPPAGEFEVGAVLESPPTLQSTT